MGVRVAGLRRGRNLLPARLVATIFSILWFRKAATTRSSASTPSASSPPTRCRLRGMGNPAPKTVTKCPIRSRLAFHPEARREAEPRAACRPTLRHAAGAARAACRPTLRHAAGAARAACHPVRPASTPIRADEAAITQRPHAIGRQEGGRPGGGPASSPGPWMARRAIQRPPTARRWPGSRPARAPGSRT
jgi:hypothetical protein